MIQPTHIINPLPKVEISEQVINNFYAIEIWEAGRKHYRSSLHDNLGDAVEEWNAMLRKMPRAV